MLPGKIPHYIIITKALAAILLVLSFSSCFTIVKKYPADRPFVYKTNINLIGKYSNEEKESLISGLEDQLDDSVLARRKDNLLWNVLKRPSAWDSINADNSIVYMRALLHSRGYFNDSIYYNYSTVKYNNQYRTTVDFFVQPGKVYTLDSISYNLRIPELQRIADSTIKESFIKKGAPFAKPTISAELDRLTELFRNSGYLRFSRDELVGLWDTLDVSLLQPTLDPFEQLEILQKLKERRNNPTANLEIRLKSIDSSRLVKFYNGHVTVYPEYTFSLDTGNYHPRIDTVEGITVIQSKNRYKAKIFPPNIYFPKDSVYRFRRYLRTITRLNGLGTWRYVNIDQVPRIGQDTVDFVIKMTPAQKYTFNTNIEGSVNQSAISGNLFGIGLNVGLQNRNFAKAANISNSNIRYGLELGNNSGSGQFIQTQQIAFSHSIYAPRIIPDVNIFPKRFRDNFRTVFNFNAANTERRLLYNLTTLNGSYGYEFQTQRRKIFTLIRPINIEYSHLIMRDSLNKLIDSNPSLKSVFTDGFIASIIGNFTMSGGSANRLNIFRANIEQSGLFAGMIHNSFLDTQLYRYIKIDAEFARLLRFPKSALGFRFFIGAGYEYDFTTNPNKRDNLPFFKQYFSGGPNSMRAWALRRLGPGSTIKTFDGYGSTPDRYGDIQLEANLEYRFPIARPFGIKLNGAVFTDVGNVWFMKSAAGRPKEEVFNFGRLGKDLAVGAGAGLRVDLNFFILRFEYAYKVKDPSPAPEDAAIQNKWFGYKFFKGDQFQLGIGYPFIF